MTDKVSVPESPSTTPAAQPLYGPTPPWNVLSIVSLIASLVGFGLAGIITGHLALGQLKTSGEQGKGLALAGTIVGYASIAAVVLFTLIMVVMAVVFPLIFVGIAAATRGY
ncbi:MAG: DUF4190 domain-containing protein [Salinibacterium sp.]|nr:DUF4190 domain-containing protein [Salinibacterium sp.]